MFDTLSEALQKLMLVRKQKRVFRNVLPSPKSYFSGCAWYRFYAVTFASRHFELEFVLFCGKRSAKMCAR